MSEIEIPLWFVAAYLACAAASLASWVAVLGRKAPGEPLLPREPRRPVPWPVAVGLFPALFLLFLSISAFAASPLEDAPVVLNAEDFLLQGAFSLTFVSMILCVIYIVWQPRLSDLGLPRNLQQLAGDIAVGATACLMALVPVYGLNVLVSILLQSKDQHPAIEHLLEHPTRDVFAAAFLVAVLAAPIMEEIVFRLLLQGSLEKLETRLLALNAVSPSSPISEPQPELCPAEPEMDYPLPTTAEHGNASADPTRQAADVESGVPDRWPMGLPRGWLPILVSSLLFAIGHVGQGPAPIALFVLAIGLGYVYQQTHRIVPCIVLHMLFNALSMVALAGMILRNES